MHLKLFDKALLAKDLTCKHNDQTHILRVVLITENMFGTCTFRFRDILVVSISTCTHIHVYSQLACTHAMYRPIHHFTRAQSNAYCVQLNCQFVHSDLKKEGGIGFNI